MLNTIGHSPLIRTVISLLAVSQVLCGCAATRKLEGRLAESEAQNRALQEENRRLASALNEQKNTAARLQMELVRTRVSTDGAHDESRGATVRESLTVQDRIPPPNSKAEAVICLAEAEGEINSTKESAVSDMASPHWSAIDGLLADSRKALAEARYDQACSLAFQALHVTREAQLQAITKKVTKTHPYADFAEPMSLITLKKANLRGRASSSGRIQDTLSAGTEVLATGYRGRWIKVISEKGQVGWVHYSLLEVLTPDGLASRP